MMMMDFLPAVADGAAAGAAAGSAGAQQGSMWGFLVPVLVVLVVMTFISSRTQKKQREKQQKLMDSLVKGSKIRTIGGFNGTVVEVKADTILIELAEKMPPVELVKSAIATVLDDNGAAKK